MSNEKLDNFSDEELQLELKTRKVERIKNARLSRGQRLAGFYELIRQTSQNFAFKPLVVDILAPTHDRTSCNDQNTCNGFVNDKNLPRCVRCTLLKFKKGGGYFPEPFTIKLSIVSEEY